jgi:Tfp pilus assembly protein PilP
MRSARILTVALIAAAVGCGDDDDAPRGRAPAQPTAAATPGAAGAGAGSNKNLLVARPHVEDQVACPIPDQPSDPRAICDLNAPSCGEHLYCLKLARGSFCEPCAERDGIRHAFRERDFDGEHNRDPFQPAGAATPAAPGVLTKECHREDQLVATNYSYSDLKLVGIVAQGTQRKVLMMGGPLGYIIKRGDCVGKEKALVKDIGLGYVTFQVEPDEYSVQLNPKQLMVNESELPQLAPRTTIAPAVPPPIALPPIALPPTAVAPGAPAVPPRAGAVPAEAPPVAPGAAPAAGSAAASGRAPAPVAAPAPAPGSAGAPARVFVPPARTP